MKKMPLLFCLVSCCSLPLYGIAAVLCPQAIECDNSKHCHFLGDANSDWKITDTQFSAESIFYLVNATGYNNSDTFQCIYRNKKLNATHVSAENTFPMAPDTSVYNNKWVFLKNGTLDCPSYHMGYEPIPPFDCPLKKKE
jgi:hypothetical protein